MFIRAPPVPRPPELFFTYVPNLRNGGPDNGSPLKSRSPRIQRLGYSERLRGFPIYAN